MSKCSKVRYANLPAAVVALRAIAKVRAPRGQTTPRGAYLCSPCRCWHLTAKRGIQTPPWAKGRGSR